MINICNKCNNKCAVRIKPNARIIALIESKYQHLFDYKKCRSLLKKYLLEELFNTIKHRVTYFGSTLLDVIQSGIENPNSELGVYAPDGEAYQVFYELFDQIIADYHGCIQHPIVEYGIVDRIKNLDHENKYMISIKISCNRSLYGYPFNPRLSEAKFEQIETRVSRDLLLLTGSFKGTYHPFINMQKDEILELFQEDYVLHSQCDRFLKEAIGYRHWPIGRGIFYNTDKNFYVWINIEDHLCVVSKELGGNLGECYRRFVTGLRKIGGFFGFMHDQRLGYLNFCPTHLGTGMEIAARLKLYNLHGYNKIIKEIALRYNLCIDIVCKDNCSYFTCIVVYKPKIGMNEFETVKWVQTAIFDIIRADYHVNLK